MKPLDRKLSQLSKDVGAYAWDDAAKHYLQKKVREVKDEVSDELARKVPVSAVLMIGAGCMAVGAAIGALGVIFWG